MQHDYTDEEINKAENEAFRRMPVAKGHEWVKAFLDALPERPQSQAELATLRQPLLADDGRSLDQVYQDAYNYHLAGNGSDGCCDAGLQAVAAVVLAQAVRRMEDVPVEELNQIFHDHDDRSSEACLVPVRSVRKILGAENEEKTEDAAKRVIAELNQRLIERTQDMLSKQTELVQEARQAKREARDAKAELAALRHPILADDGRSLGQVAFDAGNIVQKIKFPEQEIETWGESAEVHDMLEAAAQAVAAVVLAQAVRRMEAVPVKDLAVAGPYHGHQEVSQIWALVEAVRARLIEAAKGEGQAIKGLDGLTKERCLRIAEIEGDSAVAAGQPDVCPHASPHVFCETCKADPCPLGLGIPKKGEGQAQGVPQAEPDPYARLKAYAKAGARIRTHDTEWNSDVDWSWCFRPEHYEVHPDDLHLCPEYAPQAEPATFQAHGKVWTRHTPGDPMPCEKAKRIYWLYRDTGIGSTEDPDVIGWERNENKNTDIIGWRYADEPAKAQQDEAQPWTPAVGDVVRLKSGGPVMTVHYIAKDGSTGCVHNANGHFEFTTVPAACLTPARP